MIFKRVHHIAIIVSNYKESKRFYLDILGFKIESEIYREEKKSYKLDLSMPSGERLEIFSFPNPPKRLSYPEAVGFRHVAFETDSIDESVESLKRKGISVEPLRRDDLTGKRFTFFSDPDGLPIEIYEV